MAYYLVGCQATKAQVTYSWSELRLYAMDLRPRRLLFCAILRPYAQGV